MELFRAEGRPVDAVFSNPSSAHDNGIPWLRLLFVGGAPAYGLWHDTACSAKYQGLSKVALVKDNGAVHRGDAALVASVLNAFPYPFEYALWMKKALGNGLVVVRRAKAEHVSVKDKLCAKSCSKRVPVYANYAGKCTAIGVKGRGAVVGLNLEGHV